MSYIRQIVFPITFLVLGFASARADCVAHFQRPWGASQINADSLGPDCAHAVLVLTIRDAGGNAIWTSTHRTADLMTFQNLPKLNTKSMVGELKQWVEADRRMASSANLPDWPQTASDGSLPPGAEFPFRVAERLDRKAYLALRNAKVPMMCFVSGMESQTCLVLDKESVTDVGTQSFPG